MKKIIMLCLLFAATKISFGQGLSGINYQAIARNLNGTVLDNKAVQVRFTITAGNAGAVQYKESQNVTTNAYGLFNVVIGKGTPVSGTFAGIPWSNANQWLEVEVGVAGGSFTPLGKMAFQSVPFSQMALQAFPAGAAGGDLNGSTYPNPVVAAQAITTGKLADNSVTTLKITDANVTTSKLADGAVTAIKIAPGVIPTSLPPNGVATGDLSGTYPAPTVVKLQGNTVSNTVPANGQVLTYNSTTSQWEPTALPPVAAGPWTRTGTKVFSTTLSDNVSVGSNNPVAKMEIRNFDAANNTYTTQAGFPVTTGLAVKDNVSTGMLDKAAVYGYTNGGISSNTSIQGEPGNSGVTNIGLYARVDDAPAAGKNSYGLMAYDARGAANTYAAKIIGKLQITDNNSEGAGKVLTSDAVGNATWQTPIAATGPWTKAGTRISPTTLTDNVGVGTGIPIAKMEVAGFDDTNIYNIESGIAMVTGLAVKDKVPTGMGRKLGLYSYVNGATTANGSILGDAGTSAALNIGVWGAVLNPPAAGKESAGVYAIDNIGSPNTYAAIINGKLRIENNGADVGRVLTSDAGGNATWQDLVTPNVGISLFGVAAAVFVPSGVATSITNWGTVRHQYGGANYNTTTGEYTITVAGVYQVNAAVSYLASAAGQMRLYVDVNGTDDNMNEVYATTINQLVMPQISYLRSFAIGDKVKLVAYQSSGVGQNIYGTNSSNGTQFSLQLIHKQ